MQTELGIGIGIVIGRAHRSVTRSLTVGVGSLVLSAAAWLLLSGVALAQSPPPRNVDLPRFDPAPAGDRFFGMPSPWTPGDKVLRAELIFDYAKNPLVISGPGGEVVGHIVEHQLLLHANVTFSLFDRLSINADLPIALVNSGDGVVEAGAFTGPNAFVSPSGAGVGDLRLGARVRIFGGDFDPFQVGAGAYLWVPTGTRNDYLTDGNVRGQPHLIFGGRIDRFVWGAATGPTFRSEQSYGAVRIGSQWTWAGGAGVLLREARDLQIGVETFGGITLVKSARSFNEEILAGAKLRVAEPIEIGLAGGRGFASGLGTPDYRAIFTAAYTPRVRPPLVDRDGDGIADADDACPVERGVRSADPRQNGCPPPPPSDRDHDGVLDERDACPDEAGPASPDRAKNGCPRRDADGDGILDEADACPKERGVASDDPKKNGCPLPADKDGDGVVDTEDACPEIPGVKTDNPVTSGCPGDADQDGFRDDQDACPKEKGVDDPDPAKRGCPKLVRVTRGEIVILEQVQFETDKAAIRSESDALLASVAQVMKEHPEIGKFEVQGHTDDRGKAKRNQTLSQQRADAVVKALVDRGVVAGRLTAKGYGQSAPVAPNDTETGRQKNRRVQFLVVDQKPVDEKPVEPAASPAPAP